MARTESTRRATAGLDRSCGTPSSANDDGSSAGNAPEPGLSDMSGWVIPSFGHEEAVFILLDKHTVLHRRLLSVRSDHSFRITGLSAIMPSARWLTGVGRMFLSPPTPLQAPKGVDPSDARGARIRRQADRSSTRVRIAKRDEDAGETGRAPNLRCLPLVRAGIMTRWWTIHTHWSASASASRKSWRPGSQKSL
jgi:hypothetical protein